MSTSVYQRGNAVISQNLVSRTFFPPTRQQAQATEKIVVNFFSTLAEEKRLDQQAFLWKWSARELKSHYVIPAPGIPQFWKTSWIPAGRWETQRALRLLVLQQEARRVGPDHQGVRCWDTHQRFSRDCIISDYQFPPSPSQSKMLKIFK